MAVTRPRGAQVNPERRQKPLHPDHRAAQEAALKDDTFKGSSKEIEEEKTGEEKDKQPAKDKEPDKPTPAPTPIPNTPPNNLTANPNQPLPADSTGSKNNTASPARTDVLPMPKV